jgi:hypothetical protein
MGNGCNGLVNCNCVTPPTPAALQTMTSASTGNCVACPATINDSCSSKLGPEWINDYSVSEGAGCILQCKRGSYSNTSQDCCIGIQSSNLQSTCDPSLNATNGNCSGYILNYCSDPSNINNSYCQSNLKTTNLNLFNSCQLKYCTDDINRINSQSLCRSLVLSPGVIGTIDNTMQAYCNQYPTDGLCCNIKSEIFCPNKFDSRCVGTAAYLTADMLNVTCPNVLTCNQYVNLSPGAKVFATNVQLNCGTTSPTNPSTPGSTTNVSAGTIQDIITNIINSITTKINNSLSNLPDIKSKLPATISSKLPITITNTTIYLVILLLIFLVVLILVILNYSDNS